MSLEPEEGDVVIPDAHAEASEAEVKKVIESEEAWRALKDHATKPVRMINFMVAELSKANTNRKCWPLHNVSWSGFNIKGIQLCEFIQTAAENL